MLTVIHCYLFVLITILRWTTGETAIRYPASNQEEGANCRNGESFGTCTKLNDCSEALNSIRQRHSHNLTRCGFVYRTEIVCCPRGLRKSAKYCQTISAQATDTQLGNRIFGGEDAEPGEFPHMALLGYRLQNGDSFTVCGGSLISERYVLTAAHCVQNADHLIPYMVRLGCLNINKCACATRQNIRIANIIPHPDFDNIRQINDLALLRLEGKAKFTDSIRPACLYGQSDDPNGLVLTGWGITGGNETDVLQKAELYNVPIQDCRNIYANNPFLIFDGLICAGADNTNSCPGDSGGPIQVKILPDKRIYSIVGISSFGIECGRALPDAYTRVSYYLDWIESIVWP